LIQIFFGKAAKTFLARYSDIHVYACYNLMQVVCP
jgi:hypothetical protein